MKGDRVSYLKCHWEEARTLPLHNGRLGGRRQQMSVLEVVFLRLCVAPFLLWGVFIALPLHLVCAVPRDVWSRFSKTSIQNHVWFDVSLRTSDFGAESQFKWKLYLLNTQRTPELWYCTKRYKTKCYSPSQFSDGHSPIAFGSQQVACCGGKHSYGGGGCLKLGNLHFCHLGHKYYMVYIHWVPGGPDTPVSAFLDLGAAWQLPCLRVTRLMCAVRPSAPASSRIAQQLLSLSARHSNCFRPPVTITILPVTCKDVHQLLGGRLAPLCRRKIPLKFCSLRVCHKTWESKVPKARTNKKENPRVCVFCANWKNVICNLAVNGRPRWSALLVASGPTEVSLLGHLQRRFRRSWAESRTLGRGEAGVTRRQERCPCSTDLRSSNWALPWQVFKKGPKQRKKFQPDWRVWRPENGQPNLGWNEVPTLSQLSVSYSSQQGCRCGLNA